MVSTLDRALEASLRVRPGEKQRAALMAAYSAMSIGAVVVGRSVRDALYLANRPARGLAGMYIISSLVIVAVSWTYARVADRIPRGTLNAVSAFICALLCIVSWALLRMEVGAWVYPALYIFVEAMGSLIVIQFWTMANDVFHAREAKRLFGIIGGGGTLANVVFGLLVARYAKTVGAVNLLWLMVVQLLFVAALSRETAKHAGAAPLIFRQSPNQARGKRTLTRAGVFSIFASPHLVLVAAISGVSAVAVTIVDFQFKTAAAAVLHQNELAGYFGRFYGICGGVAFAVQIWVTGRVLERYGILASLLPLPVGLALGSGAATVVPNPGLFVQSLAKGSDTIFRYTINDASMQLLYVPVPPHVRGRAKAFIDGVLKPLAIAATGAVLFAFKESGGEHRALTLPVLLCVGLWVVLLVRARGEYVKTLVESLARRHLDLNSAPLTIYNEATLKALRAAMLGDASTVLHAVTLVQQIGSAHFVPELRGLLKHEDPRVRAVVVERLGEVKAADALEEMRLLLADPSPEVRAAALGAVCAIEQENSIPTVMPFLDITKEPQAIVRAAAAVALIRHAGLDGVLTAAEPLKALLAAADPRDRASAADALGNIGVRGFYRPLLAFLKDADPMVRRRALTAAGKLKTPELIPALIDGFKSRQTTLEAASALTAYGPGIEQQLSAVIADENALVDCRRGVALVLGRLGTRAAADALTAVLQSQANAVRKAAARALTRLLRRARVPIDTAKVEAAVRFELEGACRSLASRKRLQLPMPEAGKAPRTAAELLGLSLLEERDSRILQTLELLGVLLPQVRLDVVAENLSSETAAARGNAIEVLDNALPEPWKRLVLAALDDVKRRSDVVAPDPRLPAEVCRALVAGESSAWVAACAVRWSLDPNGATTPGAMITNLESALHSHSPQLREAAAVALAHSGAAGLHRHLVHLEKDSALSVRRTAHRLLRDLELRPATSPGMPKPDIVKTV
jgi:AAA family ATP:ADP antiporter